MLFPQTIFASRNTIYRQWWHLFSEVLEVGAAILHATIFEWLTDGKEHHKTQELWDRVSDEAVDTQQSSDTLLHIAMDQHGADSHANSHCIDCCTDCEIGCKDKQDCLKEAVETTAIAQDPCEYAEAYAAE
jgi:hypothetical protein